MPELPDVTVYVEALERRIVGRALERVRLVSPFFLRTVEPPIAVVDGRRVEGVGRLGKRIVIALEDDLRLVIHLMIAGRFRWRPPGTKLSRKLALAALDFDAGSLVITEAGSRKRASLHVAEGDRDLAALDRGGIEIFDADSEAFREALTKENHTLKRALTDPRLVSGIGNAYSDEILHRARLSPVKWTRKLSSEEIERLFTSCRTVLTEWIERLRGQAGDGFPEKVTAFRPEMAVHGRAGKPCPDCAEPIQRIAYAETETNYCAQCQTGGRLLRDRSLSRLLRGDWPKTLDELEERRRIARGGGERP